MSELIDRVHQVELKSLATFIELCEAHQLTYTLLGGSLLGAIRHKGFIPWDDDLDVGMPRESYNQFIELAKTELPADYFLQTETSDQNYAWGYMKLLDRKTYIVERNNVNNARKGVFIDIFPLDRIPNDQGARDVQIQTVRETTIRLLIRLGYRYFDTPFRTFFDKHDHTKQEDAQQLRTRRLTAMTQYNQDNQLTHVKNLSSQYDYDQEVFTIDQIHHLITVPFETLQVKVPADYDTILTQMYHDYQQWPDEADRVSKHLNQLIMDNQVFYNR
ncbi:LicD family protein [Levilactobacillus bambusae]|uniref:LicD family protein n=1 Tax=Levilactobacillus bambusae TaxID=2024736 RepID=A0A2V1MWK2_9LACO|nr:LicD family protein [Levilactobacillus bambusae]PWF99470.1 LicD family protein [Levilactobacillus bambusae]